MTTRQIADAAGRSKGSGEEGASMVIALTKIRKDGGTQPRAALDYQVATSYAEDMTSGASFPPVVVYFDGETHWLADGYHRVLAAELAHRTDIEADIRQGTQRDAILHSVGVNAAHGLRRTAEDKRRAVMRLLEDEEWRAWSDRAIAEKCSVSDKTVAALRRETAAEFPHLNRKGRDGKTYTVPPKPARTPSPVVNEMPLEEPSPRPSRPDPRPEAKQEAPRKPEEPPATTTVDLAIADIRIFIDATLEELPDNLACHAVINEVIKYAREKSLAYNRTA